MTDSLSELIDLLREKGVSEYSGMLGTQPVSLKLLAQLPAAPVTAATVKSLLMDEPDTSICKCSHHVTQHNSSGQCIEGCAEDKCSPPADEALKVVS